jgi:hypothetical protein
MAVLTPTLRKFALTAHVTSSVGWLGAVGSFLVLAAAGLIGHDDQTVRSVYIATELTTWYAIVPLAFASLLTGLVVALGTSWGLFRHYWVLVKFMLTILATTLLLLHTQPIGRLAAVAREMSLGSANVRPLQVQVAADATAAVLALLVNVTLSIYKPRGMTAYGRRRQQQPGEIARTDTAAERPPAWIKLLAIALIGLIVTFIALHLAGSGLGALHHR